MPIGRPSSRTPEVVAEICERLANGEPLAKICRDERMPNFVTVWRWENEDAEFRNLSARARIHGTHYLADECIEIADDTSKDTLLVGGEDNEREVSNTEWIARSKLRIDTRLRLIGKWNAKVYGDKQTTEHTGPDGGPVVVTSARDRAKALAALLAKAKGEAET